MSTAIDTEARRRRWEIALHESAHLVVAKALGASGVATAVIFPTGDGLATYRRSCDQRIEALIAGAGDAGGAIADEVDPPDAPIQQLSAALVLPTITGAQSVTSMCAEHGDLLDDGQVAFAYARTQVADPADNLAALAAFHAVWDEAAELVAKHRDLIVQCARAVFADGHVVIDDIADIDRLAPSRTSTEQPA